MILTLHASNKRFFYGTKLDERKLKCGLRNCLKPNYSNRGGIAMADDRERNQGQQGGGQGGSQQAPGRNPQGDQSAGGQQGGQKGGQQAGSQQGGQGGMQKGGGG